MRNQNYQTHEELTEAIIRYLGNQKIRTEKNTKKKKENDLFAKSPGRFEKTEPKKDLSTKESRWTSSIFTRHKNC